MNEDPRYVKLKSGLSQLTIEELERIIDFTITGGKMVCDTYIYDSENRHW